VGRVLDLPVVTIVPHLPAIARLVDAGLLGSRRSGPLDRALRSLA
jgi:hypothetical protein